MASRGEVRFSIDKSHSRSFAALRMTWLENCPAFGPMPFFGGAVAMPFAALQGDELVLGKPVTKPRRF